MTLIKKSSNPWFGSSLLDVFNDDKLFSTDFFQREQMPAVNIKENDKGFDIEAALPGIEKDAIQIELDNRMLTISGEVKEEHESTQEKYARREFSQQSFRRSFSLPENADENSLNAKYENGILKISLSKKANGSSDTKRTIAID